MEISKENRLLPRFKKQIKKHCLTYFALLSWKRSEEFKDFLHTFLFAKAFTHGVYEKSVY